MNLEQAAVGVVVAAIAAWATLRLRAVNGSGAAAGFVLGAIIWACLGWRGFVLLAAFVVLGSVATRWGYSAKVKAGVAQEHGGRRGARNVLANGGVATLAAFTAAIWPQATFPALAFAGAVATAAGDTLASEVGARIGGTTRSILGFARVPPGTNGGVSLAGTMAGLAASLAIAALAAAFDLVAPDKVLLVTAAGLAGNLADSVLGAAFENRGKLDNESVNLLATLVGALVAGC